jgi:AraC-like DNA-binding protein
MPTTSHRKFKLHRKKTKAVERALTRLNPVAANRPREPMSIDHILPIRSSRRSVLVAHSLPLVTAGLTTVLSRLEGCEVRVWSMVGEISLPTGAVVVGDLALASQFAACACKPGESIGSAGLKFVLLTNGTRQLDVIPGGCVSVWLSIDSPEQELLGAVQSLLSDPAPAIRPAWAKSDLPPPVGTNSDVVRARGRPTGGLAPGALRKVRDQIESHFEQKIDLSHLARIAGLSTWHFSKAFKQSTGMPPHRYVLMRRSTVAAELIRSTSKPLSEIALEVGFSDQGHFTRIFTQITGETPGALRHRYR